MTNINNGLIDGVRQAGLKIRDASITGGLPGTPLGYRLRGATSSGAPLTGTWKAGDQVPDRNGVIWTCTVGGSGTAATWVQTGTVTGVTAADTSVVIGGTAAAPTVRTGTLDVIAADHPPAANWSNNSHKITSLANGSAASDAAALGQVVNSISATDTSIVVTGGSGTTPTIATGTLDVIAADHPAAADWSNNSHKITSLTAGTASTDAANVGETVTGILTTKGDLVIENATPAPARLAVGSSSPAVQVLGVASGLPAWVNQNYEGMFGDGSDGSVTFDGSTTILGLVPASNVYTMTRDILCTSITINNGVTVKTGGYRIFCAGTITNNGTIGAAGAAGAAGGGAGGAGPVGTLSNGKAGGAGSANNGSAGTNSSGPGSGAGGAGGAGGTGTAGTAGTAVNNAATYLFRSNPSSAQLSIAAVMTPASGGAGGGGGGGDATNSGGGGGAGGPIIMLIAYSVNNGSGTITAAGGAGGSPAAGNAGGGGGGGGGNIIVFTLSAWTAGTTSVAGGTGGTLHGGSGAANGSNGNAGTVLNVVLI